MTDRPAAESARDALPLAGKAAYITGAASQVSKQQF